MIHAYKLHGYNIVLDVNSGSIHLVDPLAYDLISIYEETAADQIVKTIAEKYPDTPKAEIRGCMEDIEALRAQGKLFSRDAFAAQAPAMKAKTGVLKALCLHVAHGCNLRCAYCFAEQGAYHGETGLMPLATGKRAIDFLIENSPGRHNLEIDFFGGEPLLNWDVVKELVRYARSLEAEKDKHFRFTLTTNGLLLDDEVTAFCNEEMHNVVLSLDGRKAVHDRLRYDAAGRGSYDEIVPRFLRFVEARGEREYYIRGTYTAYNTDFLEDILHMADLGFDRLSMEPVVAPPEAPYALKESDLPALFAQYEALALEMARRRREGDRPFTFYHYMLDLENGPCVYKRIAGCGSGTEYLAVSPDGSLYPCHQFVGEAAFRMGSIFEGITKPSTGEQFASCNLYTREECRNCWAKFYCAGGCTANAFHASGRIEGVYELGCALFKKRLECAIMLKAAEAEEN